MAHAVVTLLRSEPQVGAHECSVCHSSNLVDDFHVKQREYVRCADCGLTFLKHIDPEDERTRYEDGAYDLMENQHRLEFKEAVFERGLGELERLKTPGRLLDVGCGNGLFLSLARKRGWETYGVELSPAACAHSRNVLGLNVIHGSLPEIRFSDCFFDVVTLYDVLCHVPSPLEQLIEIHRILKVGGLLVLRVRNALFHVGLIRLSSSLEPYLVFHLYCFTPKTVDYLLRKAGFNRTHIRNSVPTPSDPYAISPLWGDRGMEAIKRAVYYAAEALSYLSAHALLLGPSLGVHAMKGHGDEKVRARFGPFDTDARLKRT